MPRTQSTAEISAHTFSQRLSSATLRPQRSRPSAVRSSGHPMTGEGEADVRLGHDTLDGGRQQDTLDGGPGRNARDGGRDNDILDGGPGRDTLDGGPGADTMVDNRGPTLVEIGPDRGPGTDTVDVRDGRGDDTVFCGSRSSTVIVDTGDSAIGRCGKVSRSGPDRGQTR